MGGLIAIVEDEPDLQALYRLMLERKGYHIAYVSASADDAVRAYERTRPDLVIMDKRLAGCSSGVDAARRILDSDPGARILFATADADAVDGDQRFLGVLQKPFTLDVMMRAIEGALLSPPRAYGS